MFRSYRRSTVTNSNCCLKSAAITTFKANQTSVRVTLNTTSCELINGGLLNYHGQFCNRFIFIQQSLIIDGCDRPRCKFNGLAIAPWETTQLNQYRLQLSEQWPFHLHWKPTDQNRRLNSTLGQWELKLTVSTLIEIWWYFRLFSV